MSHWQPVISALATAERTQTQSCCIPLAHLACVDIDGDQTDSLLQGQLTCNLKSIDKTHWSMGAHCTPKGRMISNFLLHRTATGCRLVLSADLCATQTQALGKYSPLYRGAAMVKDRSEELLGIGLIGADALAQLSQEPLPLPEAGEQLSAGALHLIRMPDDERLMIWGPHDEIQALWGRLSAQITAALPERWQLAEIQQGRALVTQSLSDRFIPQQLNLDQIGGVSFNKGCYTGQEIVARLQYRGKQKNHLHRLLIQATDLSSGTLLLRADNNEEAGELINTAALDSTHTEALALIRDSDLENSKIRLAETDAEAVSLLEFPYTVVND